MPIIKIITTKNDEYFNNPFSFALIPKIPLYMLATIEKMNEKKNILIIIFSYEVGLVGSSAME
jgi:hypothetical protein